MVSKTFFEGVIEGDIIDQKQGESGFGYDPIFKPNGYKETFAQLGDQVKNTISHRALAVKKLCDFLSNCSNNIDLLRLNSNHKRT